MAKGFIASVCVAVGLLVPPLVLGSEPPSEPEVTLVIVWRDGRWNYVTKLEEKNGTIIYQKPGQGMVAAKNDSLDERTTRELNRALESFASACSDDDVDLTGMFELTGRSKALFHPLAARMSGECYQRLRTKYEEGQKSSRGVPSKGSLSVVASGVSLQHAGDGSVLITDQTIERAGPQRKGLKWPATPYGRCLESNHPEVVRALSSIKKPEDSDLEGDAWAAATLSACDDLQSTAKALKTCVPDSTSVEAHSKFVEEMNAFIAAARMIETAVREGDTRGFERGYRAMLDGLFLMVDALEALEKSAPGNRASVSSTGSNEEFFVGEIPAIVRSFCQNKWADDYEMRAYCEKQQFAAIETLKRKNPHILGIDPAAFQGIRNRCKSKWEDDYRMREYCEKSQIESLQELDK